MSTPQAPDYDPRYDRAQTINGAKARYVSDDLPEYGEEMLEADLERLLNSGENPDKQADTGANQREMVLR